ncbi:hypothetical protein GCM10009663_60410 [Kitasatospora arboriphila]|uniref:Uncharacterized protein n=1 Tax=Kitasatospora arboriphila TaxID=258052 RepID=A0ABN1U292_9ACTN
MGADRPGAGSHVPAGHALPASPAPAFLTRASRAQIRPAAARTASARLTVATKAVAPLRTRPAQAVACPAGIQGKRWRTERANGPVPSLAGRCPSPVGLECGELVDQVVEAE